MNISFDEILGDLPNKKPRSRLEPFADLIHALIRHGSTYRDIAAILRTKCDIHVSISTIHDFVRRRAAMARKRATSVRARRDRLNPDSAIKSALQASTSPQVEEDEIRKRIGELKLRRPKPHAKEKVFDYDPDEPLRLPAKSRT